MKDVHLVSIIIFLIVWKGNEATFLIGEEREPDMVVFLTEKQKEDIVKRFVSKKIILSSVRA